MAKPELYMWGERGLVATFFKDVSSSDNCDRWTQFLVKIGYSFGDRRIAGAWCVVEPDFSNKGFGRPDAVFRLTFDNGAVAVFLLEAKLTTFEKASRVQARRNESNFNSTINGQIELNHRLALALQNFRPEVDTALAEPDWVRALYEGGSMAGPRQVKKPAVLGQIAGNLAQPDNDCYYHVVITTDSTVPWTDLPRDRRPRMLVHSGGDSWEGCQTRLCWANWRSLREIANEWEGSSFCETYDFFRPNFAGRGPAYQQRPARESYFRFGTRTVLVTGVRKHSSRVVPTDLKTDYFPKSFKVDNDELRPLVPQPQFDKRQLQPERGQVYLWAPQANETGCPPTEHRQPKPPVLVKVCDAGGGETSRVVEVDESQGEVGQSFLIYPHHLRRNSSVTPPNR